MSSGKDDLQGIQQLTKASQGVELFYFYRDTLKQEACGSLVHR